MSEDLSPPDLFGHRAPLGTPRRRRVAEARARFAPFAPPAPPLPASAPGPTLAQTRAEAIPEASPPPDPRDALAMVAEGDDETLSYVAREAVRLLRRRIERATDAGDPPPRALVRAVEAIAADLAPEGAMADPDMDFAAPKAVRRR